jgi:DNA-binding beta-propeller fold protein YncE
MVEPGQEYSSTPLNIVVGGQSAQIPASSHGDPQKPELTLLYLPIWGIFSQKKKKTTITGYSGKIVSLEYDPVRKAFERQRAETSAETSGKSPSFVGFSPDGRCLFATNEVSDFRALNATGSISSFTINHKDHSLRHLSTALTAADPVALAVSPDGKHVVVAE